MKRTILVTIMLLFAGLIAFAQQTGTAQSSAQIKQNAQQTLTQAKSNSSQFESTMDTLNALNGGNIDAGLYEKLKAEIDRLEADIKNEQTQMQAKS